MALTQLDKIAALVVIDLQKGIVPIAENGKDVVAKSAELARAFRARGLPVVLVNVDAPAPGRTDMGPRNFAFPDNWTELVPELEAQADDILVTKHSPGAFLTTSLQQELLSRAVSQIFLTGIATGTGVSATGDSARDLGYNVVFVTDAMADRSASIHDFCIRELFPKMGETTTTADVLRMLRA